MFNSIQNIYYISTMCTDVQCVPIKPSLKMNIFYLNGPKSSSEFIENKCTHCAMELVLVGKCTHRTGNICVQEYSRQPSRPD